MRARVKTVICAFVAVAMLSSCGKYSKLNKTLDAITVTNEFPLAMGGAYTLAEVEESVYFQQKALCDALAEAYEQTDIDTVREKHPEINRNKMMYQLSNRRQQLNVESNELFMDNVEIILEDVQDCKDKHAYTISRMEEAQSFYSDYGKLKSATEEDFQIVSKIFVSYAFSENSLAKRVIVEYRDLIVETATRMIEYNASRDEAYRANIAKNNEIIRAINEVLGGVSGNTSYRKRINDANRTLLEKTLNSMSSVSQSEKERILNQFEEA